MTTKPEPRISLAVSQQQQLAVAKGEVHFNDTDSSASVELKAVSTPAVFMKETALSQLMASGNFDLLHAENGGIQFHQVSKHPGIDYKKNKKGEEIEVKSYTVGYEGQTDGGVKLTLTFQGDSDIIPADLERRVISYKIVPKEEGAIPEVGTGQTTMDKFVKKKAAGEEPPKEGAKEERPLVPPPASSEPLEPVNPKVETRETNAHPYEDWTLAQLKTACVSRDLDYPKGKKTQEVDFIEVLREDDELIEAGTQLEQDLKDKTQLPGQ